MEYHSRQNRSCRLIDQKYVYTRGLVLLQQFGPCEDKLLRQPMENLSGHAAKAQLLLLNSVSTVNFVFHQFL